MDIRLNLINCSADINNSDYVIFQENPAGGHAIAWMVIRNLGIDDYHPFVYSSEFEVGATDADGNYMPSIPAQNGSTYEVIMTRSGHSLQPSSTPAAKPEEVEIGNNLPQGAIDALIYRDGKLAACKQNVTPGSKAIFTFQPKLYIGVASQVVQGSVMDSDASVQCLAELNLLGIASADIVITGGGAGPNATPFVFSLSNVT